MARRHCTTLCPTWYTQTMVEQWKAVVGYEGLYEVSNIGRVKSLRTDKVLSPWKNKDGATDRLYVSLYKNRIRMHRTVHSLLMEAFVGPRPEGHNVLHKDGNASNNVLHNLRYGTQSENIYDAVVHNTHPQAVKTECPRGHALESPNLIPSLLKRGCRTCLACNRAKSRKRYNKWDRVSLDELSDIIYEEIIS